MIRILLADDHQVLADGIGLLLQQSPHLTLVGHVLDGRQVEPFLNAQLVDVVLLDLDLPGKDGIEVCRQIRKSHPSTQVLILSMHTDPAHVKTMMQLGAKGYLSKNISAQELVKAIEEVAAGKSYLGEFIQQQMLDSLRNQNPSQKDFIPKISSREKEVLALIVEGQTNAEIAENLHISIKTVESHRTNLLHKLNAKNTAALVRICLEKGLL